jgi:hypothetical protein
MDDDEGPNGDAEALLHHRRLPPQGGHVETAIAEAYGGPS